MKLLITGGTGYIGSHACVELLNAGYDLTVVDNLSNSTEQSLERVEELTGKSIEFEKVDLLDKPALDGVMAKSSFGGVIHFAGLKAVGESVAQPMRYYENNISGTLNLLRSMEEHGVKNIVFSSSATVYGNPEVVPVKEDFPLFAMNPYGHTKLWIEQILKDLYQADQSWNIAILRYFNPVGAHESGIIGEDPNGIPNNLLPFVAQVAVGRLPKLSVFGNDYPTPDGTGIRDYIHVVDLVLGHLKALEKLQENPGLVIYNLGTGKGYSVLEVVQAFEKASGREIPYQIAKRRPGDAAIVYADSSKAKVELGWEATRGIDEMCADTWRWQSKNPHGYRG